MQTILDLADVKRFFPKPVVAIGVFDGLHRGHQHVIRKVKERALAIRGTSMVITFSPHPLHVLKPSLNLPLIISFPYRLLLIEKLGIDVCVVINFTKRFASLSPQKFIEKYLMEKIKPREIIVGDDFRFGQNRSGTLDYFETAGKEYGFRTLSLRTQRGGRKTVSSTKIRELISSGTLRQAEKLLNRPVSLMGEVVRGDGRGQGLGYPTANIRPEDIVIPPVGVYAVKVRYREQEYPGMANIGCRPSFKNGDTISVEVHIFDFHKNIYGQNVIIQFVKKTRDERRFATQEELIAQLKKDEKKIRTLLSSAPLSKKSFPHKARP